MRGLTQTFVRGTVPGIFRPGLESLTTYLLKYLQAPARTVLKSALASLIFLVLPSAVALSSLADAWKTLLRNDSAALAAD